LKDLNRPFLIKAVGVALAAYAILSTLTILLVYVLNIAANGAAPELSAMAFVPVLAAPILIIAAIGLFRRKAWARIGAVIGLLLILALVLVAAIGRSIGVFDIIWIAFSAFMIFFFLTDAGVRLELSR
jgi:hypothetical protein